MKKVLTKFIALSSIGLFMLSACKKDGALVTSNGGKAGTLTASATTLPLDKSKVSDTTTIIHFSFTAPNYGFAAGVSNTLQIDAAGDNWANPTTVAFSNKVYSQGYSTGVFNNLVLKLNLPAGVASQVNARVAYSVSANVAPVYSNVVTLSVTPFNLTSWLYITGAFASWENPGPLEDSLISVTGNGVYTGIINFPAGSGNNQFLILPAKNWNNKYATSQSSTPTTTVTYNAGNNINAPAAAGYYIVTFNLNTGAITFTPADFYSIIGSAPPGTAWNNDVAMKFVNDGNNTWVATGVTMSVGEYKFREDDQWTWSWGPTATIGTITDTGATGDGNIQLTKAGTYTLSFVMPPTPSGTTPPVTTTFSIQ